MDPECLYISTTSSICEVINPCFVDDQRGPDEDGNETNVQEEFEELLRMYIDGLTQKGCVLLSLKQRFCCGCILMDMLI